MSAIAARQRLIEQIAKLRYAERRADPAVREQIASVRRELEDEAGPTATRATAARLLGVSQTALERWIARGDVPVLLAPSGREEVPLHALLDLIEAVRDRRTATPDDPRPLASVLHAHRAAAASLDTADLLNVTTRRTGDGHRRAELTSLAYHRALARRLDERVVRDAADRLARWRAQGRIDPTYASDWEGLLERSPERLAQLLGQDNPRMRDLRQSSPFAGALTEPERRRVLAAVAGLAA